MLCAPDAPAFPLQEKRAQPVSTEAGGWRRTGRIMQTHSHRPDTSAGSARQDLSARKRKGGPDEGRPFLQRAQPLTR